MKKLSLGKDKIRILLLEGVNQTAIDAFHEDGYENLEILPHSIEEDELCSLIGDYHLLGIRSRTQITPNVLAKAQKLIAIGCFCIGTNQVDLSAAKIAGIPVFNAPYSNTRSVAELVIGSVIFLMRGIPAKNAAAHRGDWFKTHKDAYEVRGKTLGIVGYGNIGTQVGVLAESLGMQVQFYDIQDKLPLGNAHQIKNFRELLRTSDVVTLHVPDTKTTRGMIGLSELQEMKAGSHIINASRGSVVNIEALTEVLKSKHLSGASVDVFPEEPKSKEEKFHSPLQDFDNVILTPHIGGSTVEAQQNIGKEVASKLIKYSNDGTTTSAVNFVEVELPPLKGKHRMLHIHKNQPGVLAAINELCSSQNLNIAGQYLQTDPDIGYVVMDIDPEGYTRKALKSLKDISGTIRSRILY